MRFDNFEDFWNNFGEQISSFGLSKNNAKNIFSKNVSTLQETLVYTDPDIGTVIKFVDQSEGSKIEYCAFSKDGVKVLPSGGDLNVSTTNGIGISFGSDKVRVLSTKDNGLTLEDYYFKTNELKTAVYDSSTLDFIKNTGFSFMSIDTIDEQLLSTLTVLPDVKVDVVHPDLGVFSILGEGADKSYVCNVSSIDGEFSYKLDSLTSNPTYIDLKATTKSALENPEKVIN